MRSITTLLFFFLARAAFGSDGILEINQTCAVQTGCFDGDGPGFPVSITEPGTSYRLTSQLSISDENTSAIEISADDVSIDLSGFAIQGPIVCSGLPIVCAPNSGGGTGVARPSSSVSGISVRNGTIRGMGGYGVFLDSRTEVTGLHARSNRLGGINVGTNSIVSGCRASQNGSDGIRVSNDSTVSGNSTLLNGADGIFGFAGVTILGNTAADNGDDGISCGQGCLVRDNAARSNNDFGIVLATGSGYGANVITENLGGTVSGGFNILLNVCDGPSSPQCP